MAQNDNSKIYTARPIIEGEIVGSSQVINETRAVLRNTYLLLSGTLLFSAGTAALAMLHHAAPMNPILMLVLMFGLLFGVQLTRNSGWGILFVFAFTGMMGYTLGPILSLVMHQYSNGTAMIFNALGTTGIAFLGLSAFAITSKKDFSHLYKFLFIGLLVMIGGSILNIFLKMPAIQLAISSATAVIAAGLILFDTSRIINGGERNYISATVSLYLDIYMLFVNLLQLLMAFTGNRD